MNAPKSPAPPEENQGGPESVMPGERSGEGSRDLFGHIVRDERRKAGLPKRPPPAPDVKDDKGDRKE